MVPLRWVQASMGVRSSSRKIPTNSASRYMLLQKHRDSTFASVEEKGPRRLMSGSEASAVYMARYVGM